MSSQKQCPRGHIYEGDTCPYCRTEFYPNTMGATETLYTSRASSSGAYTDMVSAGIPLCPHCGRPVRKFVPVPPKDAQISSIKCLGDGIVPWNYGWDGRCENCGHDFSIIMNIDMGSTGPDNCFRKTTIKASSRGFLHHITCNFGEWRSTVLSGVEIETHCERGYGTEKIFISANELKYLMNVLQGSPILKQLDYYQEGIL